MPIFLTIEQVTDGFLYNGEPLPSEERLRYIMQIAEDSQNPLTIP